MFLEMLRGVLSSQQSPFWLLFVRPPCVHRGLHLILLVALVYSVISPLINALAFGTFFAFYQLYKYLFLWVYEQSPSSDTGGLFFPKAIQHLFVGLYIEEVSLSEVPQTSAHLSS
jgi:hypothetical protein